MHKEPQPPSNLWTGGCACGEIRYVYEGQPVVSLKCHCLDCRAWSGAGHMGVLFGWADGFRLESGQPSYYAVKGGSGKEVRRGWCPTCGSGVLYRIDLLPTITAFVAGTLDDPQRFAPEAELWTQHALGWDPPDPALRNFEAGFEREFIVQRLQR